MATNVIHNILTATDRKRLVKRGATVVPGGIITTDNVLYKSGVDKAKRRKLLRRNLLTLSAADESGAPEPIADINFVTGSYTVGVTSYAVTDLFADDPGDPALVFTPSDVVGGSGLKGSSQGGTSTPSMIGALRTAIIGTVGSTMVFEFVHNEGESDTVTIDLYNSTTFIEDEFMVCHATAVELSTLVTHTGIDENNTAINTAAIVNGGVNKIAITLSKTGVAASGNGEPETSAVSDQQIDWTQLDAVGIYQKGYRYLRRITVYEPLDASELPALSA